MNDLQKRYDVLFEMYVEHIHEHRLGVGKTCDDCVRLANEEIERRLTKRALAGGDSAPLQAVSKPRKNPASKRTQRPPTRR